MEINSRNGIRKMIAIFAFLFLGEAYASGYVNPKYENITYKFESIYPDIETMNQIEESFKEKEALEKSEKQAQKSS